MKIQYLPYKIYRFDVNNESIKNRVDCDNTKIEIRYEFGVENVPEKHIWIGLRIATHIQELTTQKEVIGYVFGFRGIALIENREKDLKDLLLFISSALLNYQLYFEQNAPKELSSFQLMNRPNENEYANNLMNILLDSGVCYPK
jgi:hypothetical protein